MKVDPATKIAFITNKNGELFIYDFRDVTNYLNSYFNLIQNAIDYKQVIKLKKSSTIRALDICPSDGRIFIADFDLGDEYFYRGNVPFSTDYPLELVSIVKAQPKCRVIKYWEQRNELYLGCAEGRMSVIDINQFNQGPICKLLMVTFGF